MSIIKPKRKQVKPPELYKTTPELEKHIQEYYSGTEWVAIQISMPAKLYTDFKVRKYYDGFRKNSHIINSLFYLYINKDPDLMKCIDKIKDFKRPIAENKQYPVWRRQIQAEYTAAEEEEEKWFSFSQEEVQNLFDVIEGDDFQFDEFDEEE